MRGVDSALVMLSIAHVSSPELAILTVRSTKETLSIRTSTSVGTFLSIVEHSENLELLIFMGKVSRFPSNLKPPYACPISSDAAFREF